MASAPEGNGRLIATCKATLPIVPGEWDDAVSQCRHVGGAIRGVASRPVPRTLTEQYGINQTSLHSRTGCLACRPHKFKCIFDVSRLPKTPNDRWWPAGAPKPSDQRWWPAGAPGSASHVHVSHEINSSSDFCTQTEHCDHPKAYSSQTTQTEFSYVHSLASIPESSSSSQSSTAPMPYNPPQPMTIDQHTDFYPPNDTDHDEDAMIRLADDEAQEDPLYGRTIRMPDGRRGR